MEGDLKAIPLTEVLELVHAHRRSGVLEVRTGPLPLTLRFALGEVVGASILDWEGPDALFAFPLHPEEGVFRFVPKRPPEAAQALMPFSVLLGEWARVNDEWDRFRTLIDSPSRVLRAIRPGEPYGAFLGGKSVRAAAKAWGVPLIIAMERAYMGVREGDLYPSAATAGSPSASGTWGGRPRPWRSSATSPPSWTAPATWGRSWPKGSPSAWCAATSSGPWPRKS